MHFPSYSRRLGCVIFVGAGALTRPLLPPLSPHFKIRLLERGPLSAESERGEPELFLLGH